MRILHAKKLMELAGKYRDAAFQRGDSAMGQWWEAKRSNYYMAMLAASQVKAVVPMSERTT